MAQSQILGYPLGLDGLSGEWPCGTMVSWPEPARGRPRAQLNAKFWVQLLWQQAVGPANEFSFCSTSSAPAGVYAQGLVMAQTGDRLLVLINKRSSAQSVVVAGAAGNYARVLDAAHVYGPLPPKQQLITDTIALPPFAIYFIQMKQGEE